MSKKLLLSILFFALNAYAFSQKTITGTITEKGSNTPVPGVTVIVKSDPSKGTISGPDGKYSIQVKDDAQVLVFSFIGMKTVEEQIGGRTTINITMADDAQMLEDVIVTAIGVKREKRELGYAAQNVDSAALEKTTSSDLVSKLSGRVAGLSITQNSGEPGAAANIAIRGRSSLTGSNYPLIVIDGIPVNNSSSSTSLTGQTSRSLDINPEDIESISVLKGASASALYGIEAANGVLMITTKKGVKGQKKTQITVKSSITFENVNKLPERQSKYAQGYWAADGTPTYEGPEGQRASWGPLLSTLFYDQNIENPYDINGAIVTSENAPAGAKQVEAYDNVAGFFNTGIKTDNYVSVSGAGDVAHYMASAGYVNHRGIIPNSEFDRSTFRLNGGTDLTDKIKMNGSMSYINSSYLKLNRGSNASGVMFGLMRSPVSFDIANNLKDPVNNSAAYMFPDGSQRTWYNDTDNPYWSINKNQSHINNDRFIGNLNFDAELFPGLTATYRVGIDQFIDNQKTYWANGSKHFYGDGVLYIDQAQERIINSDLILNYEKQLADDWKVGVMGGHNYKAYKTYGMSMEGTNFIIPEYYNISNVETIDNSYDYTNQKRIVGLFYDAKINFKNYLYISHTGRNDWSSTLSKDNSSFFYPSVNVSWIFTETFGMEKNKYISYGKFRANYAHVAKDAPIYQLSNYYNSGGTTQGLTSFFIDGNMGNYNIKPEDTRSIEIGADLRFFMGRLNVDLTYYNFKVTDQIVPITVPYSTGYATMLENIDGKIVNNGIELLVSGTPVERKDFKWDVAINFAKNKNVVKNVGFEETGQNSGVASTKSVFIGGEEYGILYGTRWLRNENGQIVIGSDGLPEVDSVSGIVGNPNPKWTMGITNTFTYKSWSLDFLFDIKYGGEVYNGTANVMRSLGTHADTENRDEDVVFDGVVWDETNQQWIENTTTVKWGDYYQGYGLVHVSEAAIEDASWIRLRTLSLTYKIPSKKLEKFPIKGLSLGISGNNLLLFTNYDGIDPETNLSGVSNSTGRDYFNMPSVRSYSFTVKMNF
jgi:TonB-linked SusC/RagA family outer membrane protein